jgi:hypothetical protein
MKSKWLKAIINGAIYIISWYSMYFFSIFLFKDSPANQAYAMLNGWWFALYMSQFLEKNIIIFAVVSVVHLCFLLLNIFSFHDFSIESIDLFYYFGNLLVFVSPILINIGIKFIVQKYKQWKCGVNGKMETI